MDDAALRINNLNTAIENQIILKELNIRVESGEFYAICGPNGVGKSTLLRHLIKELKAEKNRIFLFGTDIHDIKQKDIPYYISYTAQKSNINYTFKVSEFVEMGHYGNPLSNVSSQNALELLNIQYLKDKSVTDLSSGEFQLVQLACAVCQDPFIFLLDEPINNLDPYHQIHIMNILRELNKNGKTIICVLHDLNMALSYCENCILLKNGSVFKQGKTEDVLSACNVRNVFNTECEIIMTSRGRRLLAFYDNPCSPDCSCLS